MHATLKWMFGTALLLAGLLLGFCFGIYAWGVSSVQANLAPNSYRASTSIKNLFLRTESIGINELRQLNPVTVWWAIHQSSDRDRASSQQLPLLDNTSRMILLRSRTNLSQPRRHAAELATIIRISRRWSFDEVVNTNIAEARYGRGAIGIEAAALSYYGVPLSQLRTDEGLALIVLLRSPSLYDPSCRRERFEHRYIAVARRLGMDTGPNAPSAAVSRMLAIACAGQDKRTDSREST
jgi:Transglycosylase